MSDINAARHAAIRLKAIAQRQVKLREARPKPVRPSEQMRRFQEGEEHWRLVEGQITPEQYQHYVEAMTRRMEEG